MLSTVIMVCIVMVWMLSTLTNVVHTLRVSEGVALGDVVMLVGTVDVVFGSVDC